MPKNSSARRVSEHAILASLARRDEMMARQQPRCSEMIERVRVPSNITTARRPSTSAASSSSWYAGPPRGAPPSAALERGHAYREKQRALEDKGRAQWRCVEGRPRLDVLASAREVYIYIYI